MDLALASAFVATSFAIAGFALLRKLRKTVADNRRQVSSLTESVQALETRLVQLSSNAEPQPELAASALQPAQPEMECISSEIQAVITAAAVALFGQKARLRSARLLSSQAGVSSWSQQGRVIVQTSHNLRPKR
jgi:hypothetical protein